MNHDTKREVMAGVTLFMALAYVVPFNAAMLAPLGVSAAQASTMTVIVVAASTAWMALRASMPFAVGPGVIFLPIVITTSEKLGLAPSTAFGMVFLAGLGFLALVYTGVINWIFNRLPGELMIAVTLMLGLFLILKGGEIAEISGAKPSGQTLLFGFGLIVTVVMMQQERLKNMAMLGGIIAITAGAWVVGSIALPDQLLAMPELKLVEVDIIASFDSTLLPVVGMLLLLLVADIPVVPIALTGGIPELQEKSGKPKNFQKTLQAAALLSPLSSFVGMAPNIIYFESGAAITAGGRTWIVPTVMAVLFLPLLFFSPLIAVVPPAASALVLVVIGYAIASNSLARASHTPESNVLLLSVLATFLITESLVLGIGSGIFVASAIAARKELRSMPAE